MRYSTNPKNGDRISQLGLGCMRLPRIGRRIDQEKADEMVASAIELGINYFDTAYVYPGSEEALGKALMSSGKRDNVFIATKLPHYMCKKTEDFERVFDAQLKRLRSEWVDYYLMHMLSNKESWERLKSFGIEDWIEKKRKEGRIRNIGFSFHGGCESFITLLDEYSWDCCMVQYNYYDENDQASAKGVRAAYEKGVPLFVMEPLRGGMLADKLPDDAKRVFRKVDENRSPAEWALRWVYDQPEVTMALSGMSSVQQIAENTQIADNSSPGMISGVERSAYKDVIAAMKKSIKVPCTTCGYCIPCPQGVDIPSCFSCYNVSYSIGLIAGISQYVQVTGQMASKQSDASKCVACGKCEKHCPQKIQISNELLNVKRRMLTFILKPLLGLTRKILHIS